jgi:hypothetical protein
VKLSSLFSGCCPACGDGHVRRSHAHGAEFLLRLFLLYPLRCQTCQVRFWSFRRPAKKLVRVVILLIALAIGIALMWQLFKMADY